MTLPPLLSIHPSAAREARSAFRWYLKRSEKAAAGFLAALQRAIQKVVDDPESWMSYLHGTRAFRLRRYPYVLVYSFSPDLVEVWAVAATNKRPGYWRKRLN
ncbi:MAG: type II toxin-antitoxin system RelE/ParE family toxin [Gemmataceae bacterium]